MVARSTISRKSSRPRTPGCRRHAIVPGIPPPSAERPARLLPCCAAASVSSGRGPPEWKQWRWQAQGPAKCGHTVAPLLLSPRRHARGLPGGTFGERNKRYSAHAPRHWRFPGWSPPGSESPRAEVPGTPARAPDGTAGRRCNRRRRVAGHTVAYTVDRHGRLQATMCRRMTSTNGAFAGAKSLPVPLRSARRRRTLAPSGIAAGAPRAMAARFHLAVPAVPGVQGRQVPAQ